MLKLNDGTNKQWIRKKRQEKREITPKEEKEERWLKIDQKTV